jgi:hypothetical protein
MANDVLNKGYVVNRIRELASSNGGRVSFDYFLSEIGIPAQRLRQQPWFPGWNALLEDWY